MSDATLLRSVSIFQTLDQNALHQLATRCVSRDVAQGNVLFTMGEACRGLYVLASGRVRIYRVSPEGKEQVLRVELPGATIAELPLFDGGVYPASAVTTEPSRLLFVPRDEFEGLIRSNPDFAMAVMRALGRRLRHLVGVTETLAFRDVAARLAHLLADYADREGAGPDRSVVVRLRRTQEELAMELGTARESVSRAMKTLRTRGLIESLGGARLRIPEPSRLRAFSRGTPP
jgi:CRP-like cAMP-binding protein